LVAGICTHCTTRFCTLLHWLSAPHFSRCTARTAFAGSRTLRHWVWTPPTPHYHLPHTPHTCAFAHAPPHTLPHARAPGLHTLGLRRAHMPPHTPAHCHYGFLHRCAHGSYPAAHVYILRLVYTPHGYAHAHHTLHTCCTARLHAPHHCTGLRTVGSHWFAGCCTRTTHRTPSPLHTRFTLLPTPHLGSPRRTPHHTPPGLRHCLPHYIHPLPVCAVPLPRTTARAPTHRVCAVHALHGLHTRAPPAYTHPRLHTLGSGFTHTHTPHTHFGLDSLHTHTHRTHTPFAVHTYTRFYLRFTGLGFTYSFYWMPRHHPPPLVPTAPSPWFTAHTHLHACTAMPVLRHRMRRTRTRCRACCASRRACAHYLPPPRTPRCTPSCRAWDACNTCRLPHLRVPAVYHLYLYLHAFASVSLLYTCLPLLHTCTPVLPSRACLLLPLFLWFYLPWVPHTHTHTHVPTTLPHYHTHTHHTHTHMVCTHTPHTHFAFTTQVATTHFLLLPFLLVYTHTHTLHYTCYTHTHTHTTHTFTHCTTHTHTHFGFCWFYHTHTHSLVGWFGHTALPSPLPHTRTRTRTRTARAAAHAHLPLPAHLPFGSTAAFHSRIPPHASLHRAAHCLPRCAPAPGTPSRVHTTRATVPAPFASPFVRTGCALPPVYFYIRWRHSPTFFAALAYHHYATICVIPALLLVPSYAFCFLSLPAAAFAREDARRITRRRAARGIPHAHTRTPHTTLPLAARTLPFARTTRLPHLRHRTRWLRTRHVTHTHGFCRFPFHYSTA